MEESEAIAIGQTVVSAVLTAARKMHPQEFQAWFCGAIVCNVVGNLSDDYWEQMDKKEPCGRAGCDCHLVFAGVMNQLSIMRQDHRQHSPTSLSE